MALSKHFLAVTTALACACATLAPGRAAAVTVLNPSFETPNLAAGTFLYYFQGLSAPGWNFGIGGIASQGSGWFSGSPPDGGTQAAFVQGVTGTLSQMLSGFAVGSLYDVTFSIASRPGGYLPDPVAVSLGGVALGTYAPESTVFTQVTTGTVVATSASMLLSFSGVAACATCDTDSAISLVSVADPPPSVPEPASGAVLLAGVLGAAFLRRPGRAARQLR